MGETRSSSRALVAHGPCFGLRAARLGPPLRHSPPSRQIPPLRPLIVLWRSDLRSRTSCTDPEHTISIHEFSNWAWFDEIISHWCVLSALIDDPSLRFFYRIPTRPLFTREIPVIFGLKSFWARLSWVSFYAAYILQKNLSPTPQSL